MTKPLEVTTETAQGGDMKILRMGRYDCTVSLGTVLIHRKDDAGERQLIRHQAVSKDAGLRAGIHFAELFLNRRKQSEEEYESRLRRNAEAVQYENLKNNPKAALTAARDGGQAEPIDPSEDRHIDADSIFKNPKYALETARQQEDS